MTEKKKKKSDKKGASERMTFKEAAEILTLMDSMPGEQIKLELPDLKLALTRKQAD